MRRRPEARPGAARARNGTSRLRSGLRAADLLPTATIGLRARKLRTALSALGIAIGIGAMVGVLGVTRSSQADLLAEIDQLGTNLLTVTDGRSLEGREAPLPATAAAMLRRVDGVERLSATAQLDGVHVYRTDRVPRARTGALSVRATDQALLATLDGAVIDGRFLSDATVAYPVTVLGSEAARTLGIDRTDVDRPARVWITPSRSLVGAGAGRWFAVAGILDPLPLAPEIDRSALIGFPTARGLLGMTGTPSRLYLRADIDRIGQVTDLLAATANPLRPDEVAISRPSDALAARAAAKAAGIGLFLGLGAVALLVGGIGIANVMVIAVLERRAEIGLRRALGATRGHVTAQFLAESVLLAAVGGAAGVGLGAALTVGMARARGWSVLLPPEAVWGGLGAALVIGTVAGLYPALRAARLAPTDALRTA
jgi:putative ABC transport system permease protein